ncbi:MAG: tetratricopeptide repeat protein [Bacteroidota bacterium]
MALSISMNAVNKSGYVYLLINSSMEGFVKIGKTTKTPEERAKELSAATGVPTPFTVAFDSYFDDCEKAEAYIHSLFQEKGFRVSANKEFFQVPLTDAIKLILAAKDELTGSSDDLDIGLSRNQFGNDDAALWEVLLEKADAFYYGWSDDILQDYAEALKLYKQAARLGSAEAYEKVAAMHIRGEGCQPNYEVAIENLKEGARRENPECYSMMAQIFGGQMSEFKDSKYLNIENAKKCWRKYFSTLSVVKITEAKSELVSTHLHLYGLLLERAGNSTQDAESLVAFAQRASNGLRSSGAYNNLGVSLGKLGYHENAIPCFRSAIDISASDAQFYVNLAASYFALENYRDMIGALQEALKIRPTDGTIYLNLGVAYERYDQLLEAEEAIRSATRISPANAVAHYNLGVVYEKLGRHSDSLAAYKKATSLKQNDPTFHNGVGTAYCNLGQHEQAVKSFKKALALKNDFVEAHFNLGECFFALGDRDSALVEYEVIKTLDFNIAEMFNKQVLSRP